MLKQIKLEIEKSQPANGMSIKIVAIDGHGGAGKTFLAKKLAKELNAEILHTDDFASYDNPMDWWPRMIEEALEPIRKGAKKLNYERGSWYKNHNPEPVRNQKVTPIMILEGVSSSRLEFRKYLSYAIWIETPKDIYLKRGIERDLMGSSSHKSRSEIEADWNKWHKYEEQYVKRDDPKNYANAVVDGRINLSE